MKAKVDAGADFLTTQMFFDNNVLYRFLYHALRRGIEVPVVAGVMPITDTRLLKRTVQLSGATLPPRFLSMADRFHDQPAAMAQGRRGLCHRADCGPCGQWGAAYSCVYHEQTLDRPGHTG